MTAPPRSAEIESPPVLDMLMLAAVHEVTHLVVADVSGLKCSWLKIRRTLFGDDINGWTWPDMQASGWATDPDDPRLMMPTPEQVRAFQLCCQGGAAGVKYWFARTWQATNVSGVRWDHGSRCDMRAARMCAQHFDTGLSIAAGHVEALRLTHLNWLRIARGAQLLYRRRSMPAKKV